LSRTVYQYANAVIPPAVQGASVSLLGNCDPVLQGLLAGFKWILDRQLGAAWALAAQGFGGDEIVADTYAVDPISEVARTTWRWPALVAWRGESRFEARTLMYDGHECDVQMVYALPPLTLEFLQRLGHIRVAVLRTCRMFIEEHGHPEYLGGVNWLNSLGLDALALVDAEEGDAFEQMNAQQRHVGLRMHLVLKEREMVYDGNISTRTLTPYTLEHADGVTVPIDMVQFNAGGAAPTVEITVPEADFEAVEGDTLTVSGTCADTWLVEVFLRVNNGAWWSLGRLSTVGETTFEVTRLLTGDEVGAVDLKVVADGPGGETTSDTVSGTVTALA